MPGMIPYADITRESDRRWTTRLLERLTAPDLPDDELDQLADALRMVVGPSSAPVLERLVVNTARPERIRRVAGFTLWNAAYFVVEPAPATLRQWWAEGDPLLRRHALLCMNGRLCPDIILQVAADPTHPLHADAIGGLTFDFERPEHQALKLAALSHSDPKVRAAAANALLFDEPVAAEEALIRVTQDPVEEVAVEAMNALEYYPSRRVIRCLHGLLSHPGVKHREQARESLEGIRGAILVCLCCRGPQVAQHIREWLRPVWDLLAFTDEELEPEEVGGYQRPLAVKSLLPLEELLALLAEAEASPQILQDELTKNDWLLYSEAERARLRPVLRAHPDPLVREEAAICSVVWQDVGGLIGLVQDSDFGVRKSAMYWLGQVPATPGVAELAWEHLHRPDTLGTHATETLATFVRHADRAVAVPRLAALAADRDQHERLRDAAVDHLRNLGATEELSSLYGVLREPPAVTWALHIGMLAAVADLRLPPPDVNHLREVDNLHLQEALAALSAGQDPGPRER